MTEAEVQKSITTIESSKRSHETWVIWYEQHPDQESVYAESCGEREHHRQCIESYDQVLSVLRWALMQTET
jgi:hypothetical protein